VRRDTIVVLMLEGMQCRGGQTIYTIKPKAQRNVLPVARLL
jgi:hypothetical protein